MDGATIGALIGAGFAAAWGMAGTTGLSHPWRPSGAAISVVLSAALMAALALPHGPRGSGVFRGGVYGVAVALELVSLAGAVWLLRRAHRPDLLLPTIGLIVGLHFIGLWKATDLIIFLWTAAGMSAVSIAALLLPQRATDRHTDRRSVVAGFGAAIVLWAAALVTVL